MNSTSYNYMGLREILDSGIAKDDSEAIQIYFSQESLLSENINLLTKILDNRVSQLVKWKAKVCSVMQYPCYYYYKTYNQKDAELFDALTRKMMLGYKLSEEDNNKLRERVPNLKEPTAGFWRELYDYIHSLGLEFKNSKNNKQNKKEGNKNET